MAPPHRFRRLIAGLPLGAAIALAGLRPATAAAPGGEARRLMDESAAALERHDPSAALALVEQAAALRPDHPICAVALARLLATAGRPRDAIAALERLARMGLAVPVDDDPAYAPLRDSPDFQAVARRLRANRGPLGPGRILFELPAMTGIIEGITCRAATGDTFFGDVRRRCVWQRRPDGSVRRFSPADAGLFGVFGLAVDEARGSLWAATTAVPEMEGSSPADLMRAALVEFALADGRVRRRAALPADGAKHVLGDLAIAADGTVFATDSLAPVIWRLPPGAAQPERWLESEEFYSLQGVAITRDGRTLLVSDYGNGLFAIDRSTRAVRQLATPPDTTLIGLDGIALVSDDFIVGVQNGTDPRRVVRLRIDLAAGRVCRLEVLERGHPAMADPTLGTLVDGRFVFVGNSGWDRFAARNADTAEPRAVPVLAIDLSGTERSH